jgi:hypothetical protein
MLAPRNFTYFNKKNEEPIATAFQRRIGPLARTPVVLFLVGDGGLTYLAYLELLALELLLVQDLDPIALAYGAGPAAVRRDLGETLPPVSFRHPSLLR